MVEEAKKGQEIFHPYRFKELARQAGKRKPLIVKDLTSNKYPVFDLHTLCECTVLNRNRYKVLNEDGKPAVLEASWINAKRISFIKGSRDLKFSTLPDHQRTEKDVTVTTDRKVAA